MSTLERAIELAARLHAGQVDKAGSPYVLHPIRVMLRVSTPFEQMAAMLHDVVEDTPVTLEDLSAEGFPSEVIRAVDALTRRKIETYDEFVTRAGRDSVARTVKIADLEDNLDLNRIPNPTGRDLERLEKYRRARALLTEPPPEADEQDRNG